VCCGLFPSASSAFDWALTTTQTETVELNSNQFLQQSPAASIGSYSTLSANAQARTPTSKFDIDVDGSYRKFGGPGSDNQASEGLNYGVRTRYEINEKKNFDREFVEAAWRQQSTALALLGQFGVALPVNGFLDTLTGSGGIDRSLTARDTVSLFATSTRTSYQPSSGGGTPVTDTLARGTWRHNISPITTGSVASEVEFLNYDNVSNTSIQIYRNQLGIDTALSPLLSFRGNFGSVNIVTEGGANPLAGLGLNGINTSTSSSLLDWIGDAALTYKMYKDTTVTFLASQSVGPSIVGSLFKQNSISANLLYNINARSTLSFSANGSRQTSTTATDFASASATYGYNFTPEFSAQLTYRYQHRFAGTNGASIVDPITGTPTVAGTSPADSHSIMVVVSHNYTVLPHGY
jgi:hypothetical protein